MQPLCRSGRVRAAALILPIAFTALVEPEAASAQNDSVPELPSITALPTPERPTVVGEPGKGEAPILTGSRLPDTDGVAFNPLIIVQDDEFRLSGTINPDLLLNDLPQVMPHLGAFHNNGGDGTVHLKLRDLGSDKTLILVNGRRWMADGTGENVDANSIPGFLIESVEVSTGGGSAVYGSGAVAGTINFRLRRIDGIEAGATSVITEEGDGRQSEAHAGYGAKFAGGRGSASAYLQYLERRPFLASQRDFAEFDLGDDLESGQLFPEGSSAVPGGYFDAFFFGDGTNYQPATFLTPGVSKPFDFGSPGNPLGDLYNYNPVNYLMTPQKRWLAGGNIEYEIAPGARLYGEVIFSKNETAQQIAAAPVFSFSSVGFVEFDLAAIAPHLSASDLAQLQQISQVQQDFGVAPGIVALEVRYRTTQLGNRRFEQDRTAWYALAGLTGELGSLTYDISYRYGRTRTSTDQIGNIDEFAFFALAGDGTCNIFGPNLLSDACMSAISVTGTDHEKIYEHLAQATLSGPVATLPWANEPATFVIGAEWRSADGEFDPAEELIGTSANEVLPLSGDYNVKEVFGELKVPLVQGQRLDRVELNGGFRYSNYSLANVDSAWSWFVGGEVAPIPDIAVRAQYQRAIRAPSISQRFAPNLTTFPFVIDPCSLFGDDFSDPVRDLCIATGVPAGLVFNFFPNFQPPTEVGGSRGLREEVGKIFTLGVVLRPRFVPRLTATIDYYDIKVENVIEPMAGQNVVDACYLATQDAEGTFCQRIARDPVTGEIIGLDATLANLRSRKARGIDFIIDYIHPLGFSLTRAGTSSLAVQLAGSRLLKSSFTPVDTLGQTLRCDGRFGLLCGDPQPNWSWTSRISWIDGPVTTSLRWRHIGSVKDETDAVDFVVERIDGYNLFDLAFALSVNEQFDFTLGVNNLFDKGPPILGNNAAFSASNTHPATYDIFGRSFFASVDVKF